ncbi:MAG: hypothetical protein MJ181_00300 [Treponema sp.]|nr:hypothetical protein [Treponema sp.]
MVYLVAALCVFNIIMWIIFGIRFHKIFSPDGMIDKARDGMNRLLSSMQKNTMTSVNLVNETIQKLEQSKIAAERKVDEINKRIELLSREAGMLQFQQTVNQTVQQPIRQPAKQVFVDPNAVYSVKKNENKDGQGDLFDSMSSSGVTPIVPKDEVFVTSSGAAYKEVPMISTRVLDETPASDEGAQVIPKITPKKSINEQVMELFNNGFDVSEIASKLNLSEVEVQFIIDLS